MRNRTYGGVRGRKTKVGRKLLRFPPTRLHGIIRIMEFCTTELIKKDYPFSRVAYNYKWERQITVSTGL